MPDFPIGEGGVIDVPVSNGDNGRIETCYTVWWTLRFRQATANWSIAFSVVEGSTYVFINATSAMGSVLARENSIEPLTLVPGERALVDALKSDDGRIEFKKVSSVSSLDETFFVDVFRPVSGGQTEFHLNHVCSAPLSAFVSVNGVLAVNGIDFVVSADTLTWLDVGFQLDSGDVVVAEYQSRNI